MARHEFHPPHIYTQDTCYFITASVVKHQPLFSTTNKRDLLRDILKNAIQDYGIKLYAWVILADHYHLLLHISDHPLYKFLKRLHGESAIQLNKLDSTSGRQVWYQYWDRFPRNDKDFWAYFNYIHLNPVKHGYVQVSHGALQIEGQTHCLAPRLDLDIHECLSRYTHSSYRYYVGKYGKEFIEDIWARFPIPNYFNDADFEQPSAPST